MALKDDWKDTGKGLGQAFSGLGKSIVRTVKDGVDAVDDWAESDKKEEAANAENAGHEAEEKESSVFNDGTWRKTGKNLGSAFADLGKTIVRSGKTGVDKATEWSESDR